MKWNISGFPVFTLNKIIINIILIQMHSIERERVTRLEDAVHADD